MCTHVCKVANGFTMPLHQNVKSCLPQLLVSLNRLKAATTQLGRGKEKERERDRERATGDMVAIVTIWWVWTVSPWHSFHHIEPVSFFLFLYSHFCLSSLFLLLSWLSFLLISSSPPRAALPLSFQSAFMLSRLLSPFSCLFQLASVSLKKRAKKSECGPHLFGCLCIYLTDLKVPSVKYGLLTFFKTRTIHEENVHRASIWFLFKFWRYVKAGLVFQMVVSWKIEVICNLDLAAIKVCFAIIS